MPKRSVLVDQSNNKEGQYLHWSYFRHMFLLPMSLYLYFTCCPKYT